MSNLCKCGSERKYNYEYDSYYCELCNAWLEDTKCSPELNCRYCSARPVKPSMIKKAWMSNETVRTKPI
jgi:DNA-directed RNA polymerase subunit RPC12/RpoP